MSNITQTYNKPAHKYGKHNGKQASKSEVANQIQTQYNLITMIAVTHVTIVEPFIHIITERVQHTVKHATNVIAVIITAKCVVVQTNLSE